MRSLVLLLAGNAITATAASATREVVLAQELPMLETSYQAAACKRAGSETALAREYYRLLNRYVCYARANIKDWPAEPGAKFHKRDGSKELDVRQNATVAFGYAVLSEFGEFDEVRAGGVTREQVRADTVGLVRYLAVTHAANFLPTGDRKPWGNHWQSAFWAGIAGQAAWLVWGRLPADTKVMVARMIIHEANRFNERPPDNGLLRDSKAEENAWNSEISALACCIFPRHPNAALWRERAIIYMMNAFSTQADHSDPTVVDGKPVKDWVTTVCIHDDFTLENHNRVHPDYLSTFTLNLRNAILFKLAGQEIPQATFHHAADAFKVLAHLTAPNGSLFYVNGQDWWPHRHDVPLMAGGLVGALLDDANAAFIERSALTWFKKMHSRFDDGRAFDPREFNYANAEEELMARYAELYLTHRLFGDGPKPVSAITFAAAQAGARVFEMGGFVTHRTREKFASFAWVNGAMGLLYPRGDTWFTSPHERSLVGHITVAGAKDTPPKLEAKHIVALTLLSDTPNAGFGNPAHRSDTARVKGRVPSRGGEFRKHRASDGFAFAGRFARCEGRVRQSLALVSLPGEPVLYIERLQAVADVDVKELSTGLIAVLNEDAKPFTRNELTVWTVGGKQVLRGARDAPAELHVWKTPWANVDDRLAIVTEASGQMAYTETHKYERVRLEQTLAANYLKGVGAKQAGELISQAVLGLLPNARHSHRLHLQVSPLGDDGLAAIFEGWLIAVNLGLRDIVGEAFGRSFQLLPLQAQVARAP